jgi:hypothetical protein
MTRRLLAVLALTVGLLIVNPTAAVAIGDCKEAPTPEVPGRGMSGFFMNAPDKLPPEQDPFAPQATTTMYEQYGYAGLRWNTYDLGCGADIARSPDAVIGTAMSNWLMNLPTSFAALTSSVTGAAFEPTWLGAFDPMIDNVSSTLYQRLFSPWMPVMLVLVGILLLIRARRASLASTAAAVGWAVVVLVLAVVLFRWPVVAGHFADDTVTSTVGSVTGGLNNNSDVRPSVAASSNVHESIFYQNWLAGQFGSSDSQTARQYGPELFKAQALTWREAAILESDPERGQQIIEDKQEQFEEVAADVKEADPAAYEYLMGKQSDTRVGYAILGTVATLLALPFLLVSALLLMGSFLIVRLAVMLFPAFATLGLFPPARGLVIGTGRVVGAALVNAVVFGVGAAVTVLGLGLILDPDSRLPNWLALVLMPLFSFVMWFALKPFRRLTAMAGPNTNPFGEAAESFGKQSRRLGRLAKKAGVMAAASYAGNVAAASTVRSDSEDEKQDTDDVPERVEARPTPTPTPPMHGIEPAAATTSPAGTGTARSIPPTPSTDAPPPPASEPGGPSAPPESPGPTTPKGRHAGAVSDEPALDEGFTPRPSEAAPPPVASEPEWVDGEEVYSIYRPDRDADDPGGDTDHAA